MTDATVDNRNDYFSLKHLQSVQSARGWYYSNHRFLGRGGNGTAFLVTATSGDFFGLQLVLKVFHRISSENRRRAFLEEARILRELSHPAIIRIFDEGEYVTGGRKYPFAVVEYVPQTVRQLLTTRSLDRLTAVRVLFNCLSALRAMHSLPSPICHRDIKPENILIGPTGAKLADFGLAKVLAEVTASGQPPNVVDPADSGGSEEHDDGEDDDLTQWPGMPRSYRTPEQIERARARRNGQTPRDITPAADIYQLGTVGYELLTGFNPQRLPEDILDDIVLDLRPLHGSQAEFLGVLLKDMLMNDPAVRPTASDCLQRLNRIHKELCEALRHATGQDT